MTRFFASCCCWTFLWGLKFVYRNSASILSDWQKEKWSLTWLESTVPLLMRSAEFCYLRYVIVSLWHSCTTYVSLSAHDLPISNLFLESHSYIWISGELYFSWQHVILTMKKLRHEKITTITCFLLLRTYNLTSTSHLAVLVKKIVFTCIIHIHLT